MTTVAFTDSISKHRYSPSSEEILERQVESNKREKMVDPILHETDARFVMFPIRYPTLWNLYKGHMNAFWRAEEIDLSKDLADWKKLAKDEKHFLSMILAFFAASDGIVLENLAVRFMNDVKIAEARAFYAMQIMMENVHSETYSRLITTYITQPDEQARLLNAVAEFPCIRKKAEWALQWIHDPQSSFATRLVAFACVEGIFFSGAFCSIFWLKKQGKMPGLIYSNEFISADEHIHTLFAIELHNLLLEPCPQDVIRSIIQHAVAIETEFICDALPCRLIGMNSDSMTQYIQFVADRLAVSLRCPAIYNVANPFDFMNLMSLERKANFFDRKVSEYALFQPADDDDKPFELTHNF